MFVKTGYNKIMYFLKRQAPLTAKGNMLAMSNKSAANNAYSTNHRFHRIIFCECYINSLYIFGPGRFQLESDESRLIIGAMIILLIRLSIEMPRVGTGFCRTYCSSYIYSRAWGMISFWVETLFLVSSRPAHPVLPQIPLELKGDRSGTPLFHRGTSFYLVSPASHGLKATGLESPWLSIHASLVSKAKEEPTEHTENTEKKGLREGVT